MDEENTTATDEGNKPHLNDVLFNTLGIGPIVISQLMNGVIREEILRSLIGAGILTKEQVEATLDEAQRRAIALCDGIETNHPDDHTREVMEKMREAASDIAKNTRKRVIENQAESDQ